MYKLSDGNPFRALRVSKQAARDIKALEGSNTPEAKRQRSQLQEIFQAERRVVLYWMLTMPPIIITASGVFEEKYYSTEKAPVTSTDTVMPQGVIDPTVRPGDFPIHSQVSFEERMKKIDPQGVLSKKDLEGLKVLDEAVKKSDKEMMDAINEASITSRKLHRSKIVDAYMKGFDAYSEDDARKKFIAWVDEDFQQILRMCPDPISVGDAFPMKIPVRTDGRPLMQFPNGDEMMAKIGVVSYEEKVLSVSEAGVSTADRTIVVAITAAGDVGWQAENRKYKATVRFSKKPDGGYVYNDASPGK